MKFKWKHGLIWVDLEIQYQGIWYPINDCILDTGSATTAIDIDLIDFNYDQPSEIKRLIGIGGGTQEVVSQQIACIIFGNQVLKGLSIEFGDLQEDLGINGFIGTDFLSQFILTLDFSNQIIDLNH